MRAVAGPTGARVVSALIAAAALTSMNATIVTGSRTAFALGRDVRVFRPLGRWNRRTAAPTVALTVQAGIVLALIALGAASRRGFETMVEYTAPVFWTFFLLTGISLFVLRVREPRAPRPFRVPLYPLTPLVFCASCAWLLHASLVHTRIGAAVGIAVLGLGLLPLWRERFGAKTQAAEKES
jgi:amino acid transporter